MRARAVNIVVGESRLMDTEELRAYTNLGRNNAMKLGGEIGVEVEMGKRVLQDKVKIGQYISGLMGVQAMDKRNSTGLKEEYQDHIPVQGAAVIVEPVSKKRLRLIVTDVLPSRKENAVSVEALCSRLGSEIVRELQEGIAREEAARAVIIFACREDGGHFLPGNAREVRAFIKTLESRGKNTLMASKSARELLQQWGTSAETEIDE